MSRLSQVAQNVYCVMRKSYFTCSYILTRPDDVILIDAGMKSSGVDMSDALRELGRPLEQVRAILITHWHNDHAAGASEIQQQTGAVVFYHAGEAPWLTRASAHPGLIGRIGNLVPESGPLVLFKGLLENAPMRAVTATSHIHDGQNLLDEFTVIQTPGHTPGHVSFHHRPSKTLFAGDALAVIDSRIRFMARPVTPDLGAARQSILKVLELDIEVLCPGHREPLARNVRSECARMSDHLRKQGRWPILG